MSLAFLSQIDELKRRPQGQTPTGGAGGEVPRHSTTDQATGNRESESSSSPRSGIGADAGRESKALQDKVSERKEFRDIWKSVMELGASQFANKEKKAYEARRIVELGGKAPKNQKVPYKILMGMLKKRKEREAKQEQMVKESGVVLGHKRAMPSIDGGRDEKRRKDGMEHDEYRLPGKLKRGTLYIDNRTAQTLSRPTGGASRRPRRNPGL